MAVGQRSDGETNDQGEHGKETLGRLGEREPTVGLVADNTMDPETTSAAKRETLLAAITDYGQNDRRPLKHAK